MTRLNIRCVKISFADNLHEYRRREMATASFDKNFVVTDKEAVKIFCSDMENPIKVDDSVRQRDIKASGSKGLSLLKRKLRRSANC